jgi:hypothetical protein
MILTKAKVTATRLRLAPQDRNDPRSVGIRQRNVAMLVKPPLGEPRWPGHPWIEKHCRVPLGPDRGKMLRLSLVQCEMRHPRSYIVVASREPSIYHTATEPARLRTNPSPDAWREPHV